MLGWNPMSIKRVDLMAVSSAGGGIGLINPHSYNFSTDAYANEN